VSCKISLGVPLAKRSAWLVVVLLWVVALLNYLDRQVIFSLFPLLRRDLGLSDVELGLLGTAFLWVYAFASPVAGYVGDRFGHRRVILFSLFFWSGITACTALAPDATSLIVARAVMGIGEAFYIPAALALISFWHDDRTRSRAIGIHQSGIYAGILIGGYGGAWMGDHYGWKSVFWLLGALGIVYAVTLSRFLPRAETSVLRTANERNFWTTIGSLLRERALWLMLTVFTAMSMASWLVYTWLPLFLFEKFSLSLSGAGFTATFYIQVAGVAGILLGGWLGDRYGHNRNKGRLYTQIAGLFLAAPFLFLIGIASEVWVLYLALICYGVGRGIYDCNIMPVLCEVVRKEERSSAYGLLNFAGTLAGGGMAYVAGALKATVGIGPILGIVGIVVLGCSALLLLVPRVQQPNEGA